MVSVLPSPSTSTPTGPVAQTKPVTQTKPNVQVNPNVQVKPNVPVTLSVSPSRIIEGDPVMIVINGTSSIDAVKSATLTASGPNITDGNATVSLHFFDYQNKPTVFYGTGINQKTGAATVTVVMKDGTKLSADFTIGKRISPTESLPVPEQLGGNSTSSQQQLVTNLSAENAIIANVYSNPTMSFWIAPFSWPIHTADVSGGIIITDTFGYNRDSGAETIVHKGADFKAPPGTPVYTVNAGYVRVTRLFTIYGNTVIVDHGMGIQSFYMHLSKISVKPGDPVKKGQLVGYSGETGYSEGPHLHLTIRIGGVSIDPMAFYSFFGLKP